MSRTVTAAQKQNALQAIELAELEITKRKQELHEFLESQIQIFRDRQADHINWLPKQVREMTMREFSQKYNGNVQAAASGPRKEKPPAADVTTDADKSSRKRKWIASVDASIPESTRATKSARLDSPGKKPGSSAGPGTIQRPRLKSLTRTPSKTTGNTASSIARTMSMLPGSPSPTKWKPPFNTYSRANSPVKQLLTGLQKSNTIASFSPSSRPRLPTASSFNMPLPPKTPVYPPSRYASTAPLDGKHTLRRTQSGILIRKDYESGSDVASSSQETSLPSSQPTEPATSQPSTSSQASTTSSSSLLRPTHNLGPRTPMARTASFTGMVTIPMKDGQQMEFDPFQTSPDELDALQGVTGSAKKHAKEEMTRLIQATMSKWRIGGSS